MKNIRIAKVEWVTAFGVVRETYAVQRRIGFFFWYTVARCESISMCLTYIKNTINKPSDKVVKVLEYR